MVQNQQQNNPNEIDVMYINHQKDEQMGTVTAYCEKYNSLSKQISFFDSAKEQLLSEVESEREFYNNLVKIRKRFPIQDAFLLQEFKSKKNQLKQKMPGMNTLYCHVIQKPDLYYPKIKKNYFDKVLLVRGKEGELEYRCHPTLKKSYVLESEITFNVNSLHKQVQTFLWKANGNNSTNNSYKNDDYISFLIEKLKFLSLFRCLEKEAAGSDYYRNKATEYHEFNSTKERHNAGMNEFVKPSMPEETSKISKEQKIFQEFHTKFTRDQYEQVENIKIE